MAEVRRREGLSEAAQAVLNEVPAGGVPSPKKPFYKKPWFIALVVFFIIGGIGSRMGNQSGSASNNSATNTQQEQSQEQSADKGEDTQDATTDGSDEAEEATTDKTLLNTVLENAQGITQESITELSWGKLQEAIASASAVADNPSATQDEIDAARLNLSETILELNYIINPDDYQTPSYEDIARNPDQWSYAAITMTGEVVQLLESTDVNELRIAVNGDYDQIILVDYYPSIMEGTRVLEGDTVTVYGTYLGIVTYTSTLGQEISVPYLQVDSITIN